MLWKPSPSAGEASSATFRSLTSLPPNTMCSKGLFARTMTRSVVSKAVAISKAGGPVLGVGGCRAEYGENIEVAPPRIGVEAAILDGPESSLAWDFKERNDSARGRRGSAMGRIDGCDGPAAIKACGDPCSGIICCALGSLSSRNRGRPRFLCCTSTHVSCRNVSIATEVR